MNPMPTTALVFEAAAHLRPGSREHEIAEQLEQTPSLFPLVERLALAAEHEVTVLLTGETGTGKTRLAGLLHDTSPCRYEPFLTLPCGALSPHLIESEFFGHAKGAFTGADQTKVGKFAAAERGTLLLDEMDVLGLEQQVKLLRVLETGEYEPVGSNHTQRSACRIIAASNSNLQELVAQGKFRSDLYYRLNVLSFHLPPLRERRKDIAPLARGLAARFAAKFRKDLCEISPEVLATFESCDWPGNIRELANVVQQAVLLSQGPVLLLRHVPEVIQKTAATTQDSTWSALGVLHRDREVAERSLLRRALANPGHSRARVARELGISRETLYKKMKKYGIGLLPR